MPSSDFTRFPLSAELQSSIAAMGFVEATPIQALAIGPALAGADIIAQAQTGTGKTAAFAIPLLERVEPVRRQVQAVVLCPTRELAVQVADEMQRLAAGKKRFAVLPVYGGQPIGRQIAALRRGAQVIVGTPGRVLDHLRRGTLALGGVRVAVLDEADEMLDMGFIEDIQAILGAMPAERQTLLFSATMPAAVRELAEKFMRQPQTIRAGGEELTVAGVEQSYFEIAERHKPDLLARLIDQQRPGLALVFCNTRRRVDDLAGSLQQRGYAAAGLHGDMCQSQRERVLSGFRSGRTGILVATDVAARGLDVKGVETVVNYDLPRDQGFYVHRVGRTARAGRSGRAYSFVSARELGALRGIQKYARTRIVRGDLPSGPAPKPHPAPAAEATGPVQPDRPASSRPFYEGWARTTPPEPKANPAGMSRLFLNLGRRQNVRPQDIVGAIAGESGIPGRKIGRIAINDRFSLVEVESNCIAPVLDAMNRARIHGHEVIMKAARA